MPDRSPRNAPLASARRHRFGAQRMPCRAPASARRMSSMTLPEDLSPCCAPTRATSRRMRRIAASTQVWVDTDGEHVIVNSVDTHLKVRNLRRDPRVAVTISDPAHPGGFYQVRGRAISITEEGGPEHIEMMAQKYTGGSYPWYGGRDQVRVVITIEAEKVSSTGR